LSCSVKPPGDRKIEASTFLAEGALTLAAEPMLGNCDLSKVNKEEILHEYRQKPGAFIPEFVALDDLAEIYLKNPGFHSSFEDFMDEWQEEDNAVECEF
jgi:hypothetical protein